MEEVPKNSISPYSILLRTCNTFCHNDKTCRSYSYISPEEDTKSKKLRNASFELSWHQFFDQKLVAFIVFGSNMKTYILK